MLNLLISKYAEGGLFMSSIVGFNDAQEKELIDRLDQISSPNFEYPETFNKNDWMIWIIVQAILLIVIFIPVLNF